MSGAKEQKPVEGRICLVCGAAVYMIKKGQDGYEILKCSGCRLEYCDPMPTVEQLNAFYADYVDVRAEREVVEVNARRNIEYLRGFGLNGRLRLLDYGSGQGAFCRVGGSETWCNYDPYTDDNDETLLADGVYDWVTAWGVLEHVADPMRILGIFRGYLVVGGYLALTTVSTESAIPYQYKPPEHVTYWTRGALEEALGRNGLRLCECREYFMEQNSDIYLSAVLRTVPQILREQISHTMPEMVEAPTNEIFAVAQRFE
ncbi:MAG: class I SAM-dependent methyltransferase [Planctomycetes bacterium]|nr:class I SAM-dependent methyltransferase [Planctomycetota bacterium]